MNTESIGNKFDVIIVGAGFAGTTAALECARAGLGTALIERGGYYGGKQVTGNLLHTNVIGELLPDFYHEPCVDRFAARRELALISGESVFSASFESGAWAKPPYNSTWIVRRDVFDPWYMDKAQKAGAKVFNGISVKDLIFEKNSVVGVVTEDGVVYRSKIVIIASGSNTALTRQVGLQPEFRRGSYILGIKEVLSMDSGLLESRFNVESSEGATMQLYGDVAGDYTGSGFLVTNRESVSIGLGINIKSLKNTHRNAALELLMRMKEIPYIKRRIHGAKSKSMFLSISIETGFELVSQLYCDGAMVVGDAAGFINANLYPRGSLIATVSGRHAAETAVEAIKKGDVSGRMLSSYADRMENSFVMRDMRRYSRTPYFAENLPDFFSRYPKMAVEVAQEFLTNDNSPVDERQKKVFTRVKQELEMFPFLREMWHTKRFF